MQDLKKIFMIVGTAISVGIVLALSLSILVNPNSSRAAATSESVSKTPENVSMQTSTSSMSSSSNSSAASSKSSSSAASSSSSKKTSTKSTAATYPLENHDLSYLTTHGYALGVASNFNIFATGTYSQSSSVGNARVAANKFVSKGWMSKIGWTDSSSGIDSHALVVDHLSADAGDTTTASTIIASDKTDGVFAASSANTVQLSNSQGKAVTTDPLNSVKDFTDNGIASFSDAATQVQNISDFYGSADDINKTFSSKFVNVTNLTTDDLEKFQKGNTVEIDDPNAERKCLVVNIPATTESELKEDTDVININIKYVTNLKEEPIVVLNFPDMTGELSTKNGSDIVNVTYGTADNQTRIIDKNHLLLNFAQIPKLTFNGAFLGTIIAPKASVEIDQLNATVTAIAAKNVNVTTSITTDGPTGVFNPGDFSDPNNSASGGDSTTTKSVHASVKHVNDDGTTSSTSFDSPATMATKFTYNDTVRFHLDWAGYDSDNLYYSLDDGTTWTKLDPTSTDTDTKMNTYETSDKTDFYPARGLKLSQSETNDTDGSGESVTMATPTSRKVMFALAAGDPSSATPDWESSITLNLNSFSVSVPKTVPFSKIVGMDTANKTLTVTPETAPEITTVNNLGAPYKLTVQTDPSSSSTTPTETDQNVFLNGGSKMTYTNDTSATNILTDPATILQQEAATTSV
ncbi:hypothetical protein IV38_GL001123 [Lactobacillus selangorensis]|uniref:Uncharacterized protein n=1 Tax=Lactobacillus selangorensis TaxID=81857 RepID=A0A0R2FJV8_9LACO|nr:collagen-binding domain-containing protein [Lactobacillus selangorensis]KRN28915.1 hypothetical protein IV38_GL001123 [Lactobacillus selangorensis]KRN32675.1 hypothetical protein IV40_GL000730 [Lactobacillus selangorensis]